MALGDRQKPDMARRFKDFATMKEAAELAAAAAKLEIAQWEERRWHRRLARRVRQHVQAARVILKWVHQQLTRPR